MAKYQEKEWLEEEYYGNKRTTTDMADECGVCAATITRWMDKYDLDRRDKSVAFAMAWGYSANIHLYANGYDYLTHSENNEKHQIKHARLLAALWNDRDLFGDWIVHHKNGLSWDDREKNLEVIESQTEHARRHSTKRERNDLGQYR